MRWVCKVKGQVSGLGGPRNVIHKLRVTAQSESEAVDKAIALVETLGAIEPECVDVQHIPARRRKSLMDEAAELCGLKKVRGALGGIYYE